MVIKKASLFLRYIRNRITRNKNFLACFVGGTGSGKSYAALCLAEQLDKTFNINRVVFSAKDFLEQVKVCDYGSVIVFDEVGTGEGAATREWYSKGNKVLSYVTQIFRHKNLIVFYTVPDISYVDKHLRKLFHMLLVTAGINRAQKVCKIKPFIVSPAKTYDKTYYIFPTVRSPDHGLVKLKRLRIKLPSKKLIAAYETKRGNFTSEFYSKAIKTLSDKVEKKELTERQKVVFILRSHTGMSYAIIADKANCSTATVGEEMRRIRKRGYDIK